MNKGSSEDGSIRRRGSHRPGRRHIQQQNIFLPMFCRLSIKDITLNQTKGRSNVPKPATISSTVQLKRNKTVASASAAAVTGTPTCSNNLQSSHTSRSTKKCFSTAITTGTSNSAGGGGSGGGRCRRPAGSLDMSLNHHDVEAVIIGNMSEMDPPLPVVKRVALPGAGGDEVNIWKRRFNGAAALKRLQIQHHQISPT
ncbi:uncharacterized protein [Henckelia pumila]|uniref:uncharacterized protein n=1 Tax=Henckelia pumila TaxID=405737 RepID=UPI003C6E86F6